VNRLRDLADEYSNEPLYLTEVCMALNVSQRTLHYCCHDLLGVSPKRYLTLRRLHLAHGALRRASAAETTVTELATRFGFWEQGRFAVAYRSVFGEPPSATLAFTRAESRKPTVPSDFALFA
jgi:AraC-like DNA-binding protein